MGSYWAYPHSEYCGSCIFIAFSAALDANRSPISSLRFLRLPTSVTSITHLKTLSLRFSVICIKTQAYNCA